MAVSVSGDALGKAIVRREQEARTSDERQALDSFWDLIYRYTLPRRAIFQDEDQHGVRKDRYVLDSTAPRALELFASFLHSNLNNPALQWILVDIEDGQELTVDERKWLDAATKRLQRRLVTTTSIYSDLHEIYMDLGAGGTGTLLVEKTKNGSIRSSAFHMRDVVVEEGSDREIDVVYRQEKWSKRVALQRFPGLDLGKSFGQGKDKKGRFLHSVFPMTDEDILSKVDKRERDRLKLQKAKTFGVWVNADQEKTIEAGGFFDMPYAASRWYKVQGATYGRSPAMTVIGDILMVNRMSETTLKAAEKLVDPPMLMHDGGLMSPVRMFPGGITYTDGPVEPRFLVPPGASRIELSGALIEQRQTAIREGFFVPLFMDQNGPVKTATQYLGEQDERNRAVGPMLVRMHHEFFDRWVPRSFRILNDQGEFGPMPESLARKAHLLKFKYLSPITNSVAQSDGLNVARLFEGLAPWYQIDDGAFDSINIDQAAKVILNASGAPKAVERNEAEIKKVRDQRLARAQAAEAQAGAISAVEAGAKLISANK